ncbi:MAG: uncharacterized protein A8A55_0296 [Amphiamblys sp. WSBS2006]|nr:MAG: uncharacterized protein A8A55_0296 [Amphiamblys sp. WSBS2006]
MGEDGCLQKNSARSQNCSDALLESAIQKAVLAKKSGEETLGELCVQGEQLQRTGQRLHEADQSIARAQAQTNYIRMLSRVGQSAKLVLFGLLCVVIVFSLLWKAAR